jgi:hypothetical protein
MFYRSQCWPIFRPISETNTLSLFGLETQFRPHVRRFDVGQLLLKLEPIIRRIKLRGPADASVKDSSRD